MNAPAPRSNVLKGTQISCMLPVIDLERARRFYGEQLGLEQVAGTIEREQGIAGDYRGRLSGSMRAGAPRVRAEKGTIGAGSLCAALFEHAIRSLTHAKAIS